ncbi:DJ-1/PfpI family protein [Porifericola rhodea]|uniref:DJ-1/PfpI family protein n=1 Tax=Porifericola rhodea TaxID=930972 RepID=UPI002664E489|nr:DJ-1/PfpI family protein [Porifericola rhodea]WKN33938.1 DJ-1/PfpI family protein [Porifericola rhodea]
MRVAYILFDGITWLDFFGVYDPVSRLKSLKYISNLQWDLCAFTDSVADNFGLQIVPTKIRQSLAGYDALIVPGGFGTRKLRYNKAFLDWVRTAEPVKQKISVCTGSLILGAAGFLINKKATTNEQEYDTLKPYCKQVVEGRIVEDQGVVTAGGVASSLDVGLYLCEKWAGTNAAAQIRKRMSYRA